MADHKSLEHWGREKAKARYNVDKKDTLGPNKEVQPPQFPEDKHDPNYNNDVPKNSWLIGDGEKKPAFDHRKKD